jgi:hypothetical protein
MPKDTDNKKKLVELIRRLELKDKERNGSYNKPDNRPL